MGKANQVSPAEKLETQPEVQVAPEVTPEAAAAPEQTEDIAAMEARAAELRSEIEQLEQQKVEAVAAVVNVDAAVEEKIRDDYAGGAMNYQQIAKKYRLPIEDVYRILGDEDLVPEVDNEGRGGALNELPAEV